jgi:hypothetical protein
MNIYVAAVEVLRKKESQDETQFTTKFYGFWVSSPPSMLMYFFAGLFESEPTLCMTELRVLVLGLSYFTDNSISVSPT